MRLSVWNYLFALVSTGLWLGTLLLVALLFDDILLYDLSEKLAQTKTRTVEDLSWVEDRKLLLGFHSESAALLSKLGYQNYSKKISAVKVIAAAIGTLELSASSGWQTDIRTLRASLSTDLPALVGSIRAKGLLNRLERAIENSLDLAEELSSVEAKINTEKEKLTELRARFLLVAADLVRLLGLEDLSVVETSANRLPLYAQGVLKGYPKIDRLSDDLHSMADLRSELVRLGGRSKFANEQELSVFRSSLEQTGVSSREIADEFAKIRAKVTDLTRLMEEKRIELMGTKRVTRAILFQVLSLISERSMVSEQLVGALKKVLAYWGGKY